MSAMRIVHLSPGYHPVVGGSEVHIQELSEGLARRGHDVTVLTARAPLAGAAAPSEMINGVRVLRFAENTAFKRLLELPGAYRSARAALGPDKLRILARGPLSARLFGELLRRPADVVGSIGWWATALPLTASLAKRFRKLRLVGIPLFHTEEPWSRESIHASLLARCDAVVANTAHEMRFIDERTGGRVPVCVGGVGIHPSRFTSRDGAGIRSRYGLHAAPVVGYAGRLLPGKGVTRLIEAMRIVWRVNDQARLLLAGPRTLPGTQADRDVDAALGALSSAERARVIEMGGFDESDKASIFDSFDVLAMPSVAESFGITYLEAWMCGKPVIGGRIDSTRCVIDEGRDGLLADPHDPADIAAAIVKLLGDPEARTRMGQAGYEKATSLYTWEKVTDRVEGVYREVVEGRRPSRST